MPGRLRPDPSESSMPRWTGRWLVLYRRSCDACKGGEFNIIRLNHFSVAFAAVGLARNGKFNAENLTLKKLMAFAYQKLEFQIAVPGGASAERTAEMLRTLLKSSPGVRRRILRKATR
jgi:hypothetical protein